MASFDNQPIIRDGRYSLEDRQILIHTLATDDGEQHRLYIEWTNPEGKHSQTLVCNKGFTDKKEAFALRKEVKARGGIQTCEARNYNRISKNGKDE